MTLPTLLVVPRDVAWTLGVLDVAGLTGFGVCFVLCSFVLRSGTRRRAVVEVLSWCGGVAVLVLGISSPTVHYDIAAAEMEKENTTSGTEKLYTRWIPLVICIGVLCLTLLGAPAKVDLLKKEH